MSRIASPQTFDPGVITGWKFNTMQSDAQLLALKLALMQDASEKEEFIVDEACWKLHMTHEHFVAVLDIIEKAGYCWYCDKDFKTAQICLQDEEPSEE